MTPAQGRMARAALDRSIEDLAADASVTVEAVRALESGGGSPDASAKLRATFEAAGIEFLAEDGVKYHRPLQGPDGGTIPIDQLNSENDE